MTSNKGRSPQGGPRLGCLKALPWYPVLPRLPQSDLGRSGVRWAALDCSKLCSGVLWAAPGLLCVALGPLGCSGLIFGSSGLLWMDSCGCSRRFLCCSGLPLGCANQSQRQNLQWRTPRVREKRNLVQNMLRTPTVLYSDGQTVKLL